MSEFNITIRANSCDELLEELEVQAEGQKDELPEDVVQIFRNLAEKCTAPKGGYIQLTSYGKFAEGEASNIVINLSSHAPV